MGDPAGNDGVANTSPPADRAWRGRVTVTREWCGTSSVSLQEAP